MAKCEKCGSTNLKMQLPILVNMDVKFEGKITKKSMTDKGTKLVAASWDRMIISCKDCLHVESYLSKHVEKCLKCEYMNI